MATIARPPTTAAGAGDEAAEDEEREQEEDREGEHLGFSQVLLDLVVALGPGAGLTERSSAILLGVFCCSLLFGRSRLTARYVAVPLCETKSGDRVSR